MVQNKRHNYVMKDFLVPIIAGVILGGFTAILTVKYNEGETTEWRKNIERQISAMEIILRAVQVNQIELAARGQWMQSTNQRMEKVEKDIINILSDNYTLKDAKRDSEQLMREIKIRHGEK
tara:strand:- start:1664 stop:2026 length:363 start_codon:yes stop_codon:yes gene_type:complete